MTEFMVLRAAHRRPQPWKNGGGVTSEVIAYPPGSGMDDFQWRASIAEVDQAGPFSCFDGVERTLVILRGTLDLTIGGEETVRLATGSEPLRFQADLPAFGIPHGGSVTDFNVMCRRDRWSVDVRRLSAKTFEPVVTELSGPALLLATGSMTLIHAADTIVLDRHDTVYVAEATSIEIALSSPNSPIIASFISVQSDRSQ